VIDERREQCALPAAQKRPALPANASRNDWEDTNFPVAQEYSHPSLRLITVVM